MNANGRYVLKHGVPTLEPDLMKWATWLDTDERIIQKTTVGDAEVSTVFLGLNHQYSDGPPILFETMVFGGYLDQEMDRYPTEIDARTGHAEMV